MSHRPSLQHVPVSAPPVTFGTQTSTRPRSLSHTRSYSYTHAMPGTGNVTMNVLSMAPAPPPYARQMSATPGPYSSHAHPRVVQLPPPRHAKTPDPYSSYSPPAALPNWSPYAQYHAPQPAVAPVPQGYGYFQWPSTESVDKLDDDAKHDGKTKASHSSSEGRDDDSPALRGRGSKLGLFGTLRRKATGPDVHLHTLLLHARPAPLLWDVRNSPASASRGSIQIIAPHDRAQHATLPPRTSIHIVCDLLPWAIDVSSSSASPTGGVTVGDVLDALHAALQRRVRRSEWLDLNERTREKVVRAFAWRCYNSPGPRGVEERQGPKRVDWLLKRTIFRGLSKVGDAEDTWELHLGQH